MSKLIILLLLISTSAISAEPTLQCTKEEKFPYIVTQCNDGTVTVVNTSSDIITVCSKLINGSLSCKRMSGNK